MNRRRLNRLIDAILADDREMAHRLLSETPELASAAGSGALQAAIARADLETLEKQVEKRRKAAKGDKTLLPEVESMEAALEYLAAGTPLYRSDLSEEHRALLKPFFLLTNKPVLAIVNVDEEQLESVDEIIAESQLDPVSLLKGIERFVKDRPQRLERLEKGLRATEA